MSLLLLLFLSAGDLSSGSRVTQIYTFCIEDYPQEGDNLGTFLTLRGVFFSWSICLRRGKSFLLSSTLVRYMHNILHISPAYVHID